ncbi:MAG: ferritin-like domain-containing protein [Phycisphaerae bacterium]|nr:ferritin-like domain-containing protein [Phycisphaerae bacterium]
MKTRLDSMKSLYVEQLADLLNAERQLVRAIPKAAKAAGSEELRDALTTHLDETLIHADRITRIFDELGEKPPAHECAAMKGLIEEAEEIIAAQGDPSVKDAAIIAAAQRMEHYEIAGYGCARTFARLIGREADADLLQTTLDEEYAADDALTRLAQESINRLAAQV